MALVGHRGEPITHDGQPVAYVWQEDDEQRWCAEYGDGDDVHTGIGLPSKEAAESWLYDRIGLPNPIADAGTQEQP